MKKYLFIVAFLMGAQKLGAQLVIGDSPKQPKAPGKSLLELNNKESDNSTIPGGLLLPKRKKAAATTEITGFSEGALVYNDSGYFEILTIKNPSGTTDSDKTLEWKRLASGAGAKRPELINVRGQVSDDNLNGTTDKKCVTITLPSGYVPYTRGAASGGSSDVNKQVVVKISYNGFGLKQKLSTTTSDTDSSGAADFEAVFEESNKVKITFLTLQPEKATDFDRILVQVVRT